MSRLDDVKRMVDNMLLGIENLVDRRDGYVHLYGVADFACTIALKRGHGREYAELAYMAGLLHDYEKYRTGIGKDHARKSAEAVKNLLQECKFLSEIEVETIYEAIYYHSHKEQTHTEFDEILKDADVMEHWLREPMGDITKDNDRIRKLCSEFGFSKVEF